MAKHYIRLGMDGVTIIKTYSDAFEAFQEGDIFVEETENIHFNLNIRDVFGFFNKKWTGSVITDMSQAEIDVSPDNRQNRINQKTAQLASTDKKIIRIIEDLITLLISKGNIQLTDFPQAVQDKIAERQTIRTELNNL
jgi:hypothetical protein